MECILIFRVAVVHMLQARMDIMWSIMWIIGTVKTKFIVKMLDMVLVFWLLTLMHLSLWTIDWTYSAPYSWADADMLQVCNFGLYNEECLKQNIKPLSAFGLFLLLLWCSFNCSISSFLFRISKKYRSDCSWSRSFRDFSKTGGSVWRGYSFYYRPNFWYEEILL